MAKLTIETNQRLRRGIIFILSAPSGAGKTTISREALKVIPGLRPSVSFTTRLPREGEIDGVDYRFVTEDAFKRHIEADEFAEWARVFDASYGTPRRPVEDAIESGWDILLDIDVHGAEQIRKKYTGDSVGVFVLPPSFDELEARLRGRGTEKPDAIERRLRQATEEALAFTQYDYLIVNASIDDSLAQLEAIVEAERLRVARLREEFAPWKR